MPDPSVTERIKDVQETVTVVASALVICISVICGAVVAIASNLKETLKKIRATIPPPPDP